MKKDIRKTPSKADKTPKQPSSAPAEPKKGAVTPGRQAPRPVMLPAAVWAEVMKAVARREKGESLYLPTTQVDVPQGTFICRLSEDGNSIAVVWRMGYEGQIRADNHVRRISERMAQLKMEMEGYKRSKNRLAHAEKIGDLAEKLAKMQAERDAIAQAAAASGEDVVYDIPVPADMGERLYCVVPAEALALPEPEDPFEGDEEDDLSGDV